MQCSFKEKSFNDKRKLLMKQKRISTVVVIFCLVSIAITGTIFGQGTVQNTNFFSNSLGTNRNVQIYLPQGYNSSDTTTKYPVIYFLHGAGDTDTSYSFLIPILNQLISTQIIKPVIVVKPDGSTPPYLGSFYTNSLLYGRFEDYIAFDLVAFVDSAYRTFRKRDQHCIMGHSMGAYGAMKLALKHPDIYRGVAAHSGPLDLNHISDAIPFVLAENGNSPPYTYTPTAGIFSSLIFTLAGAFSPDILNPPYYVDFLLNNAGTIIDSTFARWLLHNPAHLASVLRTNTNLAIYFDCGMQDELTLFAWNTAFRDSLNLQGLAYTFLSYAGTHSGQLNSRFPISLIFLDSVMREMPTGIVNELSLSPSSFVLHQNYPNPFNPSTTISFSIPSRSFVSLRIFDLLGREVATLINENQNVGTHFATFNATNLSSGIYFYRLQAGPFLETKKLVLLK
jgi:S-formylglutathione hydrolase FrmB